MIAKMPLPLIYAAPFTRRRHDKRVVEYTRTRRAERRCARVQRDCHTLMAYAMPFRCASLREEKRPAARRQRHAGVIADYYAED